MVVMVEVVVIYFSKGAIKLTLIDFRFRQHFKAQKGKDGSGKKKKGANGKNIFIEVPVGTSIYNDDLSVKLLEIQDESTERYF